MRFIERLIKSSDRVKQHGEVFTPSWMVKKMLDTPGVKEASINNTFLPHLAKLYPVAIPIDPAPTTIVSYLTITFSPNLLVFYLNRVHI